MIPKRAKENRPINVSQKINDTLFYGAQNPKKKLAIPPNRQLPFNDPTLVCPYPYSTPRNSTIERHCRHCRPRGHHQPIAFPDRHLPPPDLHRRFLPRRTRPTLFAARPRDALLLRPSVERGHTRHQVVQSDLPEPVMVVVQVQVNRRLRGRLRGGLLLLQGLL